MIATLALAATLTVGTGLDCAAGYDSLVAQMKARPKLEAYGADPTLETYNDSAAITLYAVTKAGHPAHPAFVKRKLNGGAPVDTAACGYGDPAAFEQLMKAIDVLNAAVRRNYGG